MQHAATGVDVELGTSRCLIAVLLLGHVLALSAVWLAASGWAAVLLAAAVLLSAVCSVRLHGLRRGRSAVVGIRAWGDGAVELRRRDGRVDRGMPSAGSLICPWLVIVRLRTRALAVSARVVVPADCISAESHRRLRVCLLWAGSGNERDRRRKATSP